MFILAAHGKVLNKLRLRRKGRCIVKKLSIGFALILSMLTTGCASTGKYEAWSAAKIAEANAKAEQAKALATVAATSTDKTLAAFAVFTMSQLNNNNGGSNSNAMPEEDWVGIAKAILPSVIQGSMGLIGKVMDTNLALSRMEIDAAITFNNTAALSKAPTVIYSAPTTANSSTVNK